jgi:hypothetical protein
VGGEHLADGRRVVPADDYGAGRDVTCGAPGVRRVRRRRGSGSDVEVRADAQLPRPAVVVPVELEDQVASGRGARDVQRVLQRVGAGVDEDDLLRRRH